VSTWTCRLVWERCAWSVDRHRFDPVSLVFGLVFTVAGLVALTGGSVVDDAAFLLPLGLIGLGLAVMLEAKLSRREPREPPDPFRTP
jgi:hypothetical protein